MDYRPLLKFMLARHAIYLKRAAGQPKPWTRDPILRRYKFTNVYRELDKVTVWVRRCIRERYASHPNLWFMLAIARQINWPPTLEALMQSSRLTWPVDDTWSGVAAARVLRRLAANGGQVFTGAYMISANAGPALGKAKGEFDKPELICELVLRSLWDDRARVEQLLHGTLQQAQAALREGHHGWGGFMTYEVVCDLRYTRYLEHAPDKLTWAHAGPGALRGLNRLRGLPAEQRPRLPPAAALDLMRALLERLAERWPHPPALELREIEHSLCEFDKYMRVRLGEGRPRSLYNGG